MTLRLGTRGSALARAQTSQIARRLEALGAVTETVIIRTAGDRDQTRPFAQIGAPGVFVREIETALIEDRIDLAVHSYKDLPTLMPEPLVVAAVPERVDPADRLILRKAAHQPDAAGLPLRPGATVGTASARRQALLRAVRPDLVFQSLRGNVPTRLAKLREGPFDAIVLASAGLTRLDAAPKFLQDESLCREGLVEHRLDPELFVPAPSQGAIALQTRRGDSETLGVVESLHDATISAPIEAERHLLALVEGGCQLPFGAWSRQISPGVFELHAALEVDGQMRRVCEQGVHPRELAETVWQALALPPGATP